MTAAQSVNAMFSSAIQHPSRFLRRLGLVTAAIGAATNIEAQTAQLQLPSIPTPPAVTAANFYVGPFSATILSDPTLPTIDVLYLHLLSAFNWGQQWQVNVSNLGQTNLSATRLGSGGLDNYRKAAWLTSQTSTNASPPLRADIQVAIWSLFTPGISVAGFTGQSWVSAANSFAASSAWSSFNWREYSILTAVSSANQPYPPPQEFITNSAYFRLQPTVTPEPATWLLLGTGLIAIIGFVALRSTSV